MLNFFLSARAISQIARHLDHRVIDATAESRHAHELRAQPLGRSLILVVTARTLTPPRAFDSQRSCDARDSGRTPSSERPMVELRSTKRRMLAAMAGRSVRRSFVALSAAMALSSGARADPMPPSFVDIADVAGGIAVDMRYAGANNFLGRPARGYGAARCLLTKPAAGALAEVQRDLAAFGLGLLVYDCYRPQRAVDDFVAWSKAPGVATDPRHHPVVPKSELVQRGYIAAKSGHSRGSTVDLTLIPAGARKTSAPPRDCRSVDGPLAPDRTLNMGTTFDCFDERARAADDRVPPEARRNRLLLRMAMERHGFVPYEQEWWHFTLGKEPYPVTAFDFPIERAP
jgi:zinc D-Ala-D-Ala dipeptidase